MQADREPKFWIDRSCLNPADAEADLMCWPLYLAGCKHCYFSYCDAFWRRLWCVCEVFAARQGRGQKSLVPLRIMPATILPAKFISAWTALRADNARTRVLVWKAESHRANS